VRHPIADGLTRGPGERPGVIDNSGKAFDATIAEAQVILALIARVWRLRLVPGHPVEPVGRIRLRPRDGLWVTIEPRSASHEADESRDRLTINSA